MDWKERIKFFGWKLVYGTIYRYKYWIIRNERKKLSILSSSETIKKIIDTKCSVSRFGDGEFQLIQSHRKGCMYHVDSFQKYSPDLGKRLFQILQSKSQAHISCIPYAFKKSAGHVGHTRIFFEREAINWVNELFIDKTNILYGDSCFTRFYMGRKDIKDYPKYINQLKQIWDKQDVLFIEGAKSRLGVGNDLFDNARSIKRILAPVTNAFDRYEEILQAGQEFGKDKLILVALGQTATVLAYDLAQLGYWSIDIGHIDIEYEWYLRKAKTKIAIPGKYVNEVKDGRNVREETINHNYLHEIIYRIE